MAFQTIFAGIELAQVQDAFDDKPREVNDYPVAEVDVPDVSPNDDIEENPSDDGVAPQGDDEGLVASDFPEAPTIGVMDYVRNDPTTRKAIGGLLSGGLPGAAMGLAGGLLGKHMNRPGFGTSSRQVT